MKNVELIYSEVKKLYWECRSQGVESSPGLPDLEPDSTILFEMTEVELFVAVEVPDTQVTHQLLKECIKKDFTLSQFLDVIRRYMKLAS